MKLYGSFSSAEVDTEVVKIITPVLNSQLLVHLLYTSSPLVMVDIV
jgi:hypothetical protein